jgi:hypothetical protein
MMRAIIALAFAALIGGCLCCGSGSQGGKVDLCDGISDKGTQGACYTYAAISGGESGLCPKIKSADIRVLCEAATQNDPSKCLQSSGEYFTKDCEAVVRNKPSACDALKNAADRDACYYDPGTFNRNINACNMIGDNMMRQRCYMDVAVRQRDASLCENIAKADFRGYCTILASGSGSDCAKLQFDFDKTVCEAVLNGKTDGCDKLAKKDRDYCLRDTVKYSYS